MRLPTRDQTDDLLAAQYGVGAMVLVNRPRSTKEYQDEIETLQEINRLLNEKLKVSEAIREELDGAANTRCHQLEGEVRSWKLATYALGGVWMLTIGGLWGML